jgi:Helix-turn-helix domain
MSGNELQRIEILVEVLSGRRTEASAAGVLGISTRQTRRLVVAYRAGGGASVIHKSRGRASNNKMVEGIREYELVRSNYADFGPSLDAEMLLTKHDLKVS